MVLSRKLLDHPPPSGRQEDGVTDGTRTRDSQNHNLELYQLSYGHQQADQANKSAAQVKRADQRVEVRIYATKSATSCVVNPAAAFSDIKDQTGCCSRWTPLRA